MRDILKFEASEKVFVAGSTRNGEEAMLLDAYEKILKEFPETILIIAPRHIERIHAIGALVEKRRLGYQLWTDIDKDKAKRTEQVVIINAFGELFKIYSVGTIVFCGGNAGSAWRAEPSGAGCLGKSSILWPVNGKFHGCQIVIGSE